MKSRDDGTFPLNTTVQSPWNWSPMFWPGDAIYQGVAIRDEGTKPKWSPFEPGGFNLRFSAGGVSIPFVEWVRKADLIVKLTA